MGRYSTSKVIRDDNSKRKLTTTIIPSDFTSESKVLIEITTPDRLDKLANIFYNDSTLWWVLAAANQLGKGTMWIPAGTIMEIPDISSVMTDIEQTNNER